MKKHLNLVLIIALVLALAVAAAEGVLLAKNSSTETPAAPEKHLLNTDAADLTGIDHADSVYYTVPDYYNMVSDDTLLMLTGFSPYEQTESYTCGPSSAYMVLNYFDTDLAAQYNELSIAELCGSTGGGVGTSAEQIANFFTEECGWEADYYMSHDPMFTNCKDFLDILVKWNLQDGYPVIVDWNVAGGHWTVIIGYDDMGTEDITDDVLIFADSADTHDHYQDGYMCYSAVRFFSQWRESTPFDGEQVYRQEYVVAHPKVA